MSRRRMLSVPTRFVLLSAQRRERWHKREREKERESARKGARQSETERERGEEGEAQEH